MSETTAPIPQTPNPQPPSTPPNKSMGWVGFVILCLLIGWIGHMAGCGKAEETESQKATKAMAGPDNPIVQKIRGLNTGNAYQAGYNDGLMEFANSAQKASQMQGDMEENLQNLSDLKNAFFDAVASQASDDQINPDILAE